jgi:predicted small lipoprotein YifL
MKIAVTGRGFWLLLAIGVMAGNLAACGQTGPLELPQDRDAAAPAPAADDDEDEREDRDAPTDER